MDFVQGLSSGTGPLHLRNWEIIQTWLSGFPWESEGVIDWPVVFQGGGGGLRWILVCAVPVCPHLVSVALGHSVEGGGNGPWSLMAAEGGPDLNFTKAAP